MVRGVTRISAGLTLRRRIIQRAGRLIRPQGKLTLSMASNEAIENDMLQILEAIERAA